MRHPRINPIIGMPKGMDRMTNTIPISVVCVLIVSIFGFGKQPVKNIPCTYGSGAPCADSAMPRVLDRIVKQNDLLNTKINDQATKIDRLNARLEKNTSSAFKEFSRSVALNIIAAIIFWVAFAFLPERC